MADNEILPFAETDTTTNLLTQAEYEADAQRLIGNQPGIARSRLVNKALRQVTKIASAIAQYVAQRQDVDVTDDLTPAELEVMFTEALGADFATKVGIQQALYSSSPATGTANALEASYDPEILALTDGMTLIVRASTASSSTTPTFTPNEGEVATKTIVKGNNLPLVAGDIAGAGHWLVLQYDEILDKWVLLNPAFGLSPVVGKQTIWIPAGAMNPRVTSGPESVKVQLGTNQTLVTTLAFDTASAEYAQFTIRMPKSWNEGTVTFAPVWTANSTSTNGVAWALQAKAIGNDETIDAAWGTAVVVTDANTATAYQNHLATESGAVTVANASELEWVIFEIYRDVSNGSDTLAVDALLTGVNIYYTTDAATDA